MKIAISGASGFIGRYLLHYLREQGHEVVTLGRECFTTDADLQDAVIGMGLPKLSPSRCAGSAGQPAAGSEGFRSGIQNTVVTVLEGCDAVINLAGSPINRRWSEEYKRELYDSRVGTTRQLIAAIEALKVKPSVLVSASAVGYYPAEGCYTEAGSVKGSGFLSDLCAAWEAEAAHVAPQVRLVIARLGVVLSPDGGAFVQMARPFRLGVAARLGDGRQSVSWIDIGDLVRAIAFVIENDRLHGVVNMVAPQRLTNGELTRALAARYRDVFSLAVPAGLMKMLYGEASEVLLSGQCALPEKLTAAGFRFDSPSIERFLERFPPAGDDKAVPPENSSTAKKKGRSKRFFIIGIIMAICFCSCGGHKVRVAAMEEFDINRYLGTWYEIARLDHHFERGLEQVTAHYALRDDGRVAVVNRGFDPQSGRWKEARAKAVQTDVKNYLKVYFVPFFAGKYRIAYLDADYSLAVVSGGTLGYLWLLARTPEIEPAARDRMFEVARSLGYDTAKLIFPCPVGAPAKP